MPDSDSECGAVQASASECETVLSSTSKCGRDTIGTILNYNFSVNYYKRLQQTIILVM